MWKPLLLFITLAILSLNSSSDRSIFSQIQQEQVGTFSSATQLVKHTSIINFTRQSGKFSIEKGRNATLFGVSPIVPPV